MGYEFYDSHFEAVLLYLAALNLLLKFRPQQSPHGIRQDFLCTFLFGIKWWWDHVYTIWMRLSIATSDSAQIDASVSCIHDPTTFKYQIKTCLEGPDVFHAGTAEV
jgi:hypothetical protein